MNPHAMIEVTERVDGAPSAFRCTGCAAEWEPDREPESPEDLVLAWERITRHNCWPGISPNLRGKAAEMASAIEAEQGCLPHWQLERHLKIAAQSLALSVDGNVGLLSTAPRDTPLQPDRLDEHILRYAHSQVTRHQRTDEERARQVAHTAVGGGLQLDPFAFRPLHVVMAAEMLDDAFAWLETVPDHLRHMLEPRTRPEAIEWLREFEQEACGLT